jgi:hypothetical protein
MTGEERSLKVVKPNLTDKYVFVTHSVFDGEEKDLHHNAKTGRYLLKDCKCKEEKVNVG